jgi:hypothetical protein
MNKLSENELIEIVDRYEKPLEDIGGSMRLFRYKKSGQLYIQDKIVLNERDLAPLVIYRKFGSMYSAFFARPFDEFMERFEGVEQDIGS